MRALIVVAVCFVLCFIASKYIFNILIIPYQWGSGTDDVRLVFTAMQGLFFVRLKIALFGALFIAFPVIATQIYKFMAPGLYKNEREAFAPFLVATPILFFLGACLVFFVIMPLATQFFLSEQQTGGDGWAKIENLQDVTPYLGLIMTLIFAFGLVFQLPVVITLLARAGLVSERALKDKRKYAIVLTFVAAAILTPPDPVSQLGLAVPSLLLYELSIFATRLIEKKRQQRETAQQQA